MPEDHELETIYKIFIVKHNGNTRRPPVPLRTEYKNKGLASLALKRHGKVYHDYQIKPITRLKG